MPIWLPCGPKHDVSVEGDVRFRSTGRILKCSLTKTGYREIRLELNGPHKRIHQLIANTFLPAPTSPRLVIDHIDRNKLNNHASNLRWVSRSVNARNIESANTPHSDSILQIKYINKMRDNRYRIRFKRDNVVYCKEVKTLEEAIVKRDEMLKAYDTKV